MSGVLNPNPVIIILQERDAEVEELRREVERLLSLSNWSRKTEVEKELSWMRGALEKALRNIAICTECKVKHDLIFGHVDKERSCLNSNTSSIRTQARAQHRKLSDLLIQRGATFFTASK